MSEISNNIRIIQTGGCVVFSRQQLREFQEAVNYMPTVDPTDWYIQEVPDNGIMHYMIELRGRV